MKLRISLPLTLIVFSTVLAFGDGRSLDDVIVKTVSSYLMREVPIQDLIISAGDSLPGRLIFDIHIYKYGAVRIIIDNIKKQILILDEGAEFIIVDGHDDRIDWMDEISID